MTTDITSGTPKGASFYAKRISGILLLLALSAVFLFSGYSKLFSMEAFEWTFMDLGISNMMLASVIAHLFIGLEFMIGIFLLFHIYLRSVTYPATIVLLALLTGYLVLLIIQQGNEGNCGCFGDWLYMKPLSAVWKNLGMIAATILLYYIYPIKPYKNQEWLSACLGMVAFVIPFLMAPLQVDNEPQKMSREIDLSPLYTTEQKNPAIDLRQGKHIVAFMSLTCPHCRKAAYILQTIKKRNPEIPIYMVLSGKESMMADFFKETRANAVPHILFTNVPAFQEMAGPYVPAIFWISNSTIERKSNYRQLDAAAMKQWLKN